MADRPDALGTGEPSGISRRLVEHTGGATVSETAQQLLAQIRDLHEQDQRLIAEAILDVLDADMREYDDPMDDPEWRAEFERRLELVEKHPERLLTWEEANAQIDAELARRRAARGEQ